MEDRPLKRKYARTERERRFLLAALPPGVDGGAYQRFRDRYLHGAPIRLRRVETPDGRHIVTKLGQKVVDPATPEDPRHRLMTTIYLGESEGRVFTALAADASVKRRYTVREQGRTFAVDVYEAPEPVAGLILAEVECDTDEALAAVTCPVWAVREITEEEGWSGALLAAGRRPPG